VQEKELELMRKLLVETEVMWWQYSMEYYNLLFVFSIIFDIDIVRVDTAEELDCSW